MRFIPLIYLLLGICMGVIIKDTPSVKFGFPEWLFLGTIHVPFVAFGVAFARSSRPTNGGYTRGLSPGGWGLALAASYLAGFFGFFMLVKR
ncbi:MAG TPA: hypothetical protein VMF08_11155 [Candidatus Sulfotelmatobacter sp.]|nr:hypothetical protein [Candidatus Sulfotelmatobacter sp.]